MNKIIQNRIEQFIVTKFLTSENEVTALTLLLNSIEKNIYSKHGKSSVYDKQIENKQVFILNKIRELFSNGDSFLKYFNKKTNNTNFNKLNNYKLFSVVEAIELATTSNVIEVLNSIKTKSNKKRVNNFSKKKKNHNNRVKPEVIYKK